MRFVAFDICLFTVPQLSAKFLSIYSLGQTADLQFALHIVVDLQAFLELRTRHAVALMFYRVAPLSWRQHGRRSDKLIRCQKVNGVVTFLFYRYKRFNTVDFDAGLSILVHDAPLRRFQRASLHLRDRIIILAIDRAVERAILSQCVAIIVFQDSFNFTLGLFGQILLLFPERLLH